MDCCQLLLLLEEAIGSCACVAREPGKRVDATMTTSDEAIASHS
jgi:hypothetical protein